MWNFEEWKVFCKETSSGEILPGCFGTGGDVTYLSWMVSAWGWTLSVALLALIVALAVFVYVNRDPLKACAETCECQIAEQDLSVPFCDPNLDLAARVTRAPRPS